MLGVVVTWCYGGCGWQLCVLFSKSAKWGAAAELLVSPTFAEELVALDISKLPVRARLARVGV